MLDIGCIPAVRKIAMLDFVIVNAVHLFPKRCPMGWIDQEENCTDVAQWFAMLAAADGANSSDLLANRSRAGGANPPGRRGGRLEFAKLGADKYVDETPMKRGRRTVSEILQTIMLDCIAAKN